MTMRLLLLILLVAPAASAQTAYLTADRDSVRVGEPFTLSLVVPHSIFETVVWPEAGRQWAGSEVEVIERLSLDSTLAPAIRVDSAAYRVAAFGLDTLTIGPVGVRLVRGGDTTVVASQSFALPMMHVLPDSADLLPARDIRRIGYPVWAWLAFIAGAIATGLLLWWLWKRRSQDEEVEAEPVHVIAADERALASLAQAQAFDLTDASQIKPFYVLVSDAIRGYLHERAGVAALEHTSAEVMHDTKRASKSGRLPMEAPHLLADVFAVADYAKYADGRPAPERGAHVLAAARALIERTEQHLAPKFQEEATEQQETPHQSGKLPAFEDVSALNRPRSPKSKPEPSSFAPPGFRPELPARSIGDLADSLPPSSDEPSSLSSTDADDRPA